MKLIAIACTCLIACCSRNYLPGTHQGWKSIEIGNYIFDFPPAFKLITERGIDSYVGRVKGDSIEFGFDFGYYTGQPQTPQEYLESGDWKVELPDRFMKPGIKYGIENMPKVEVLKIRPATIKDSLLSGGCDYVAKCRHDTAEFDYPIFLPAEAKALVFKIDTINNQYRKIAYTNNELKNGAEIYIRDVKSYNKSINGYLALGMGAGNLNQRQLQLVLEIFNTVRLARDKGVK